MPQKRTEGGLRGWRCRLRRRGQRVALKGRQQIIGIKMASGGRVVLLDMKRKAATLAGDSRQSSHVARVQTDSLKLGAKSLADASHRCFGCKSKATTTKCLGEKSLFVRLHTQLLPWEIRLRLTSRQDLNPLHLRAATSTLITRPVFLSPPILQMYLVSYAPRGRLFTRVLTKTARDNGPVRRTSPHKPPCRRRYLARGKPPRDEINSRQLWEAGVGVIVQVLFGFRIASLVCYLA